VCHELLGKKLNSTYCPNRMVGKNDESQTRVHLTLGLHVNLDFPMASLKEQLEAFRPWNGNGFRSQVDETNPPTGAELTNLLLLELL